MKYVAIDDLKFARLDEGTGDVIVFLHGFPLNKSMWAAQVDEFATTHRVIAPDLRGHGDSSVTRGTVTMRDMADDVANLLDSLDIDKPVTLCGLSMGGYVAWEFWRHHGTRLAGLVLCDTRAANDSQEVARARQMMATQVIDAGASLAAEAMMPKLFAPNTHDQQPDLVDSVRHMILATAPDAIAATQRGMAERTDWSMQLPEVTIPTLLLCGTDDVITTPQEMSRIAQEMPNATYTEVAGAGHLAPLERPVETNAAIRCFLANN